MSRAKGNIAEAKAVAYLQENGYRVVEQNFYSRFGEIDIIATKEGTLHFIEVKSGVDYETALQNITRTKLSRIIKTLQIYLKKNALDASYCIDAILVSKDEIDMVENITL
jgi:putative endonuclease